MNDKKSLLKPVRDFPLADLHTHVGASARPSLMWRLAHEQGIKLPAEDFWQFEDLVTVSDKEGGGVTRLDRDHYRWTELIQSSPLAMETVVHRIIGGGYRSSNIITHEIRFNPMKRNRGGERDLDYIILAAIRGMERSLLEYPRVKSGIILMLDRGFTREMNEVIYKKALKYKERAVIGIDVAGPLSTNFQISDYVDLFADAKKQGLGTTIHTGEEGGLDEMITVVNEIQPHRIGHGFLCYQDKDLMREIVKQKIILELCPTSNLNIGTIDSLASLKKIYRGIFEAGVKFTINTDGAEMHRTNLRRELELLLKNDIFSLPELDELIGNAFEASFIKDN